MKKISKFFKRHSFVFLLFLLEIILFILNYQPSWLVGWDSCLPSLNFKANFERIFFGVWQEYRGLGFLDGMAHVARLPHTILVYLLSFVLPASFLRWFLIFLMHFLGGVGVYKLISNIKYKISKMVAFLGALFYLFNIGTIQMFYTPYEPFFYHFAALPWLSHFLIKFLKSGSRKDLLWFAILVLFFIPQAFVPTIFIVYLLSVLVILLFHFKITDFFKKALAISLIIFIANAFWLLPYFYGVFKNAGVITSSKINQMSTENTLLRNKVFGGFESVALIHGYSLNLTDLQSGGEPDYLMQVWREHLKNPLAKVISWTFFGLAILGICEVVKRKEKKFYPFLVLFIICFLMLGNDIPILSLIFNLSSKYIPLFGAVFRSPFTKFSILYILSYSIFLTVGITKLARSDKLKELGILAAFTGCLLFYSLPVFRGNFFYRNLKVEIPQDYFDLIGYFKTQDKNRRLVVLPQPSFWGWIYYSWGFRGSGFVWRGVPQASMDGAFLPWSQDNENFYWQLFQAVYSQETPTLESILEKYQLNFLVLDKNIRSSATYKALYIDEIEKMLNRSGKIRKIRDFGEIGVYKVDLNTSVKDFVFLAENLPQIGPEYQWNDEDVGFLENGHYLSNSKLKTQNSKLIYYPFNSLFTGRQQEELEFKIEEKLNSIIFSSQVPSSTQLSLLVPSLRMEERIFWTEELKEGATSPDIQLKDDRIEVRIDKKKGYFGYDSLDDEGIFTAKAKSYNPFNIGLMEREIIKEREKELLRFTSRASDNSLDIDLLHLSQKIGYLVKIESRYLKGKSLLFYISNKTSKNRILETYLPKEKSKVVTSYFIIPPMEKYGAGYSLYFNNVSIGRQETINDLGRVEVYPIPYQFLKGIKLISNQNPKSQIFEDQFEVFHPNPSFYKISMNNFKIRQLDNLTLVLSQSYHPGWLAWVGKPFIGKRLKDNVLVNNWANGWEISDKSLVVSDKNINEPTTFYLFFWPQMLEYLGFGLLIAFGIWLVFRK